MKKMDFVCNFKKKIDIYPHFSLLIDDQFD